MEASVTIKMSTREFDLLRVCVQGELDRSREINSDREAPAPVRAAARQRIVELTDLDRKLR